MSLYKLWMPRGGATMSHPAKDGHKLPLTINDWKYMPPHFIENVVLETKQIFEYPEVLDDWIYTKISDSFDGLGTANTAYQEALIRIAELEEELRKYKTVNTSTNAGIRNSP
ncbi:hypothetical protein C5167_009265 [Papaver somniferum]|uniref:Uncharacterized protein n=1 Tax=Papaver somniferum TaxID=3469 RepID=A0A4Y7K0U3_PAPSO|nr:hypothetical protein C5167_009265 [Papaver somniferum]